MIFDVMEAIDVLVTAIAAWIAAGVAALMLAVAVAVWGVRAVWRGVTGAWRRYDAPKVNDCHSSTDKPAERRTAPRWKEAA